MLRLLHPRPGRRGSDGRRWRTSRGPRIRIPADLREQDPRSAEGWRRRRTGSRRPGPSPTEDLASPVVIDRLLAVLRDPVADVRAAAAAKLAAARYGELGMGDAGPAVPHRPDECRAGIQLVRRTDPAIGPVRSRCACPRRGGSSHARLPESVRGDRPPADGASQGSGAEVRAAAAGALFYFGAEAGPAVRPLLGILVNPDVATQEGAGSLARTRPGPSRSSAERPGPRCTDCCCPASTPSTARSGSTPPSSSTRPVTAMSRCCWARSPTRNRLDSSGPRSWACSARRSTIRDYRRCRRNPSAPRSSPRSRCCDRWRADEPMERVHAFALLCEIEPESPEVSEIYRNLIRSGLKGNEAQWLPLAIKPAMIPGLVKGLDDKDVKVRLATVNALANLASNPSRGNRWKRTIPTSSGPHPTARDRADLASDEGSGRGRPARLAPRSRRPDPLERPRRPWVFSTSRRRRSSPR